MVEEQFGLARVETARKCLRLISEIAEQAANSPSVEQVGGAIQELTQALMGRFGGYDERFELISADQLEGLPNLLVDLDFLSAFTRSFYLNTIM